MRCASADMLADVLLRTTWLAFVLVNRACCTQMPHNRLPSAPAVVSSVYIQPRAVQVIRLLDPHQEILRWEHLHHHLVCVSRDSKKSLRAALHHPLEANRYKRAQESLRDADAVADDSGVDENDMARTSRFLCFN